MEEGGGGGRSSSKRRRQKNYGGWKAERTEEEEGREKGPFSARVALWPVSLFFLLYRRTSTTTTLWCGCTLYVVVKLEEVRSRITREIAVVVA